MLYIAITRFLRPFQPHIPFFRKCPAFNPFCYLLLLNPAVKIFIGFFTPPQPPAPATEPLPAFTRPLATLPPLLSFFTFFIQKNLIRHIKSRKKTTPLIFLL